MEYRNCQQFLRLHLFEFIRTPDNWKIHHQITGRKLNFMDGVNALARNLKCNIQSIIRVEIYSWSNVCQNIFKPQQLQLFCVGLTGWGCIQFCWLRTHDLARQKWIEKLLKLLTQSSCKKIIILLRLIGFVWWLWAVPKLCNQSYKSIFQRRIRSWNWNWFDSHFCALCSVLC